MDGHGAKWRRNIAENFNGLSRVHERYRRQTDERWHIANVNVSSFTFAKNQEASKQNNTIQDKICNEMQCVKK